MAATQAERNKAARLRAKLRAGESLNAAQRDWLEDYEEAARQRARTLPPIPAKEPATEPDSADSVDVSTILAAEARQAEPGATVPVVFRSASDGETANAGTPAGAQPPTPATPPTANVCKIEQCPCKTNIAGELCVTTGEMVYPVIDMETATELARVALSAIGFVVKLFRDDKHMVEPSDREVRVLARGIRMFQARRARWIGAAEDFVLILGSVAGYARRAATEKPRTRELPVAA